jgi:hypothetical protein
MKKYFLLIGMLSIIVSCNTKKTEDKTVTADSTSATAEGDTANTKKEEHFFWSSDFDNKGLQMVHMRSLPDDSLSASTIIELMNQLYPEIPVKFKNQSNDTVFVNIPDSKYLTTQTGSSGPEVYFAELTYNLTEINNIHFVNITFKKGDHAEPGTYTRTDFVNK